MRLLMPLRTKVIAMLWGGLSTSAVGDQLGSLAITWIAVDSFGAAAGYLAASQAAVGLLAALFVGRWTDGLNERRLMIGADLARAGVLIAVVVGWEATGRVSGWSLAALIAALAIGQAVFRPSVQAIMPELVPNVGMLPAVSGLLDGTDRLARLLAPALIALVATRLPIAHFLTLDAASFLVSAAAVFAIGARPTRSPRAVSASSFLQGFRAMHRHPLLRYMLNTAGIGNGCWYAAMFLGVPLLVAGDGDGGVGAFGAIMACYGSTNFAANLWIGSRPPVARPGTLILSGNVVNGIGMAMIGGCALVPTLPHQCAWLAAMVAGAGGPMNDIARTNMMQTVLPPGDVAAAFRAWMVAASGGILLAMAVAPTLFVWFGPAAGIVVFGAGIAGAGAWGLIRGVARDSGQAIADPGYV